MCTDDESILGFFVGVRKEEREAREGRVGDRRGLCGWDCVGDWDGDAEGAGWW